MQTMTTLQPGGGGYKHSLLELWAKLGLDYFLKKIRFLHEFFERNGRNKLRDSGCDCGNIYGFTPHKAFTLAEVLITLGIIGIVAAMTLPSVIGNAQKEATAAKVHKFYNTINNALQLAIVEHGDVENWMGEPKDLTYEENLEFLQRYFLKHIKINRFDKCKPNNNSNAVCFYLTSGGMVAFKYDINGGDFTYYVNGRYERGPRNEFWFQFNKIDGMTDDGVVIHNTLNRKITVEPYTFGWDGKNETLNTSERGCAGENPLYCTKILQLNNWKFPKDYAW